MNLKSWQRGSLLETEPDLNAELAEILERYLLAIEQGTPPGREAFLAMHPEHAADLAKYLPWVELLYQAKPRDSGPPLHSMMPEQLGEFRIIREIGRGGMGIVYEAEQLSLARRVALKVLPFASMLDERQLARFKNEALAVAQLHHPNIVPVFAVGCERGLHHYVMQLIDGQTLEQWITAAGITATRAMARDATAPLSKVRTPEPADHYRKVAGWIVQAAEALDHAHDQGIVHRDVKPSNLMLSTEGRLWITDFGLARTQRDASMTASGELLGTLRYMAPEQLQSKPGFVDHRADIYSLGLTLYELIACRPAFDGQTQQELIRQVSEDEPAALRKLDRHVPRDLEGIVQKATNKTPEGRYATAAEFAEDLRCFLEGRPTVARPATWLDRSDKWVRRHSRLVVSAGLGLTAILVCVAASAALVWRAQGETQQALELASASQHRAEQNLDDARHAVDHLFTGVATQLSDLPGAEGVRRQLLTQALVYYQKFAAQASSDPAVRGETAAAHYRCGQINEQLGDDLAARKAYEEAQKVWLALASEKQSDDPLKYLALCENNLGLIELRSGKLPAAELHLRKALDLQGQRLKREPQSPEVTSALALAHANLGMVLGQSDKRDQAKKVLEQALELQRGIEPITPQGRGDLAATYNQLGYLYSTTSMAEAEDAYQHAAETFEQLVKDQPQTLRWPSELANARNNLAALAVHRGRLDEAEADYRRAIEIQQSLSDRAPQVVAYARDLAVSQNNFGYLLCRKQQPAAAAEQFELALANLARLAQSHEQSPEFASRLGAVCNNLGLALEDQQLTERAVAAYREAIDWQQKAIKLSPAWRQSQDYLAAHRANLLRVLQAGGPSAAEHAQSDAAPQPGQANAADTARQFVPLTGQLKAPDQQTATVPVPVQPADAATPTPTTQPTH